MIIVEILRLIMEVEYSSYPRNAEVGFLQVKWEFTMEWCQRCYFTGMQWAMGMPVLESFGILLSSRSRYVHSYSRIPRSADQR